MRPTWARLRRDATYRDRITTRSRIISAIRDFFIGRGFLEVDPPALVCLPGQEPYLSPLKAELHDVKGAGHGGYLITSPEYACKKLLAAGFKKIFSLGHVFRDGEPWGGAHNPEFTMLEWYRAHANYRDIMRDTEELVASVARCITPPARGRERRGGSSAAHLHYQNNSIDFTPPWPRLSVKQAFKQYCNLTLDHLLTRSAMAKAVASRGYRVSKNDTFDDLFFKIFLTEIEPRLGVAQSTPSASPLVRGSKRFPLLIKEGEGEVDHGVARPVILYDYPAQMAALARRKRSDPRYAERFEVYIAGIELANAFSELTDPREQLLRFRAEQKLRKKLGREVYPIDLDFIRALRHMPPAGGIALGVDRLVMLLTGAKSIEDVLLFPASELFKDS